jgi:hypothetical protein
VCHFENVHDSFDVCKLNSAWLNTDEHKILAKVQTWWRLPFSNFFLSQRHKSIRIPVNFSSFFTVTLQFLTPHAGVKLKSTYWARKSPAKMTHNIRE